ncbi:hypothetical protein ILUMI_23325 [Ignelater luminosus]|uniref:Transport and Golgi organization protein 2 n=1 Tax=Ignelater luminosus TaxID=2038154 RepID=A0A8K0CE17_IGNLU|nr:hypothetical protein ILUMI_23325 [Ignelater luminosus]
MCILFVYTEPKPHKHTYRLIVASNRDEYYQRPAKSAFLCPQFNIIGGRDMEKGREGGMWLGVSLNKSNNNKFKFGALLNLTGEERKHGVIGRGPIVADYLKSDITAMDYLENLRNGEQHNAFNFVAVELSDTTANVYHHSNVPTTSSVFESTQILGFGNSTLVAPLLKVTNGVDKFATIIECFNSIEKKDQLVDELLKLLKWEERHLPDPELQRRAPSAFEFLSAVYVKIVAAGYGTRTHSIVLVDYDWNVEFIELTMEEPIDPENPTWLNQNIKAHL